jgi:aminoglycoside phosphotransferase family enzyme/predicted kinase
MEDGRKLLASWLERRHRDEPVEFVETHISVLGFQGDRVYKLKKPVRFAFADLSTPRLRESDCEREVALNRRFAPDVYVGVLPLTDAHGDVVDHVVEMRRLPDDRRLTALVAHGNPRACLERLAADLAAAHRAAPTGGPIDRAAGADAIAALWESGIEQLARYESDVLPARESRCVAELARRYVSGRRARFDERVAAGRARDGHGDLLADDVFCLDDGPRPIDCLEFDARLRYGDVLADVAFLAMDLERLGRADLAFTFLDAYRHKARDTWPSSLADMYVAYRAHVRAKVACLRHDQGDPEAAESARALLALSHRHLEQSRIRLVVVGGPPASGKSTLATAIADQTGWTRLSSDVVRRELFDEVGHVDATVDAGLYDPARTRATYDALLARARTVLALGDSVILDASWSQEERRRDARIVSSETQSELVELHCDAPEAIRVERALRRAGAGGDPSDAGPELAATLTSRFAAWPRATTIDTTRSADVVAAAVVTDLHRDACARD